MTLTEVAVQEHKDEVRESTKGSFGDLPVLGGKQKAGFNDPEVVDREFNAEESGSEEARQKAPISLSFLLLVVLIAHIAFRAFSGARMIIG